VMRATQFHELPAQLIAITRHDSQARVLDLWPVRTVAARTVAAVLLEVAEAAPSGRAPDLAGPQEADLVGLARAFVQHLGEEITVPVQSHALGDDARAGRGRAGRRDGLRDCNRGRASARQER